MAYVCRETFLNMRHSGVIGVLSIIIVALTMMTLSLLIIITNYLNTQIILLKQSPFVVAFLDDGIDEEQIKAIQDKIVGLPQVSSIRYISKEDALMRTREMFKDRREVLDGLDAMNPLPKSFEIDINNEFLNDVKDFSATIRKIDGIEDVQHAGEASKFIKSTEFVIIIIFAIMSLSSIIIIVFSIAITTYMRREEIRIFRLVGSTSAFIRIPLLMQGILEGLIGSILAVSILYGLFNLYGMFNLVILDISVERFLSLKQMGIVIGTGAVMGLLGGAFPLSKFIKA